MSSQTWLQEYFRRYERSLFQTDVSSQIVALRDLVFDLRKNGKRIFFAGNGASASIASHGAVDFTKAAKVQAFDFNEPNFITAFSNDFGYENWIAQALQHRASSGDAVVFISSSGKSPNIIRGAEKARAMGLTVVSFSGFKADNPLRSLADIDFWVDSSAYNIVECTHMIWLMAAVDFLIGEAEYPVS
jgi:D-sedoheptulose 7-phosphate isomerase